MNELLAQLILAVQGEDVEKWANILLVVVLAAFWAIASLIKARKAQEAAKEEQPGSKRPRRPALTPRKMMIPDRKVKPKLEGDLVVIVPRQEEFHYPREEIDRIEKAITLSHTTVQKLARQSAELFPGDYIKQIYSLWHFVNRAWTYKDDPPMIEYFSPAYKTIEGDLPRNRLPFEGDCDDYAILMVSLIESKPISRRARVVVARVKGVPVAHAYPEVYVGEAKEDLQKVANRITAICNVIAKVHFKDHDGYWLNLDWSLEVRDTGMKVPPGKPFWPAYRHITRCSETYIYPKLLTERPEVQPLIEELPEVITKPLDRVKRDYIRVPAEHPEQESILESLLDYDDPEQLRRAILHYEILGKPLSLRRPGEHIIGL